MNALIAAWVYVSRQPTNQPTYNAVLSVCEKGTRPQKALEVFADMKLVEVPMSPPGPRGARGIFCAGCAGNFSVSPGLPLDSRGGAFPAAGPGSYICWVPDFCLTCSATLLYLNCSTGGVV